MAPRTIYTYRATPPTLDGYCTRSLTVYILTVYPPALRMIAHLYAHTNTLFCLVLRWVGLYPAWEHTTYETPMRGSTAPLLC